MAFCSSLQTGFGAGVVGVGAGIGLAELLFAVVELELGWFLLVPVVGVPPDWLVLVGLFAGVGLAGDFVLGWVLSASACCVVLFWFFSKASFGRIMLK